MVNPKDYHFHKDCKYYLQCTEEEVKHDGHKCIRFTCPKKKHSELYYKNDIHTIKWDCTAFEPYQMSLDLGDKNETD